MESNNVAPKRNDNKGRAYLGNTKLHNELSNPCMKVMLPKKKKDEKVQYTKVNKGFFLGRRLVEIVSGG